MRSPCIGCDFEHEDKNEERCTNCQKRIEYAEKQLMIPIEALEADRWAREETSKIKEMAPPGQKRGPKPKPPQEKAVLGRPPKAGVNEAKKTKDEMLRKGIYIRPTEFCPSIQIQEILEGVKEIANSELRSLPQQVLWILKQKVDEWKEEHNG